MKASFVSITDIISGKEVFINNLHQIVIKYLASVFIECSRTENDVTSGL